MLLLISFAAILTAVIVSLVMSRRLTAAQRELERAEQELTQEGREIADAGSLEEFNEKQAQKKAARKRRIINLFATQNEISNSDVAEALKLSSVSAYTYLEELEQDGEIEQIGKTGRSVVYKKSEKGSKH